MDSLTNRKLKYILSDLVKKVLKENPKNLIEFIQKWCVESGQLLEKQFFKNESSLTEIFVPKTKQKQSISKMNDSLF